MKNCLKVLKKVMAPQGFNLGVNLGRVGGAGFDGHLHLHIVPRWNGDTNFMPVLAETRVIPESLEQTYCKIKDAWSLE
jgi:ATP adenylyltransferase